MYNVRDWIKLGKRGIKNLETKEIFDVGVFPLVTQNSIFSKVPTLKPVLVLYGTVTSSWTLRSPFKYRSAAASTVRHQNGAECVSSVRSTFGLSSDCEHMFCPTFFHISRTPCRPQGEMKTCVLRAALSYAVPAADVRNLWSWGCIKLGSGGLLNLRFPLKIVRNVFQNIRSLCR
jgi:hypothetical protein